MLQKNEIKLKKYNCPCCNNDITDLVMTEPVHDSTLNICKYCGFIYREVFLDEETHEKYLKYHHKQIPNSSFFMKDKVKRDILCNNFIDYSCSNKRILDLFSGIGIGIRSVTYDSEKLICLEPCESHARFAKNHNNIDCRNRLDINEKGFDLIIAFNALSLIANLGSYLKDLHDKLNDDGTLFIFEKILNASSIELVNNAFQRDYVNFFTKETLYNILETNGFEVYYYNDDYTDVIIKAKKAPKKDLYRLYDHSLAIMKNAVDMSNMLKSVNNLFNIRLDALKEDQRDQIKIEQKSKIKELKDLNINNYIDIFVFEAKISLDNPNFMASFQTFLETQFPNNYVSLISRGLYAHNIRRFTDSIDILNKADCILPCFDVLYYQGLNYYEIGIYDKAAEYLNRAMDYTFTENAKLIELMAACYSKIRG